MSVQNFRVLLPIEYKLQMVFYKHLNYRQEQVNTPHRCEVSPVFYRIFYSIFKMLR